MKRSGVPISWDVPLSKSCTDAENREESPCDANCLGMPVARSHGLAFSSGVEVGNVLFVRAPENRSGLEAMCWTAPKGTTPNIVRTWQRVRGPLLIFRLKPNNSAPPVCSNSPVPWQVPTRLRLSFCASTLPAPHSHTHENCLDVAQSELRTVYHPASTCRVGRDDGTVADA